MTLNEVRKFFQKARCNRVGAQRTAFFLWGKIGGVVGDDLRRKIATAWAHSLLSPIGHKELDALGDRTIRGLTRGSCPKCGALNAITALLPEAPASCPCVPFCRRRA